MYTICRRKKNKQKEKHWGVNKWGYEKNILSMLRKAEYCDLLETGAHPLVPKITEIISLVCHSIGTVTHPPYDTEKLFEPKQLNHFQSYQHLRANLVHTWNLANQRFLITSGKSARDMDKSSYPFSSTRDSSPLQSLCFLSFLKLVKTCLGLPDLSSNLLYHLTHLQ